MVPGAIGSILLIVAIGTTLTVIGIMRLADGPSATGAGSGKSLSTPATTENRQPVVPLPSVAPTATQTPVPAVTPTAIPTAEPTAEPTVIATEPPAPTPTAVVAEATENPIHDVFERLKGSVVRITTESDSVGIGQPFGEAGSGFVIDEDGHILTNYHVIKDGRSLHLTLDDGTPLAARIVGIDPGSDVALLKANIPRDKLVVAPLGSSASVRVGDQVITIGSHFYTLLNTMTSGYVSGLGRNYAFSGRTITGMIQSDAAINQGSSGGPLIDLEKGEVVGINTAIQSSSFVGIAFALPIDRVKAILPDLRAGKTPTHAWLPIHGASITPHLATRCNLPVDYGVIVYGILPGATLNSGDKTFVTGANGDIIVSIDDLAVRNLSQLSEYIDTFKKPGDTVEIRVYRQRKTNELLEVTLEEWPNKLVQPLTQAVDCSNPTSEPTNVPTAPPITAETTTNAASGRFIISAEPLRPAITAAASPTTAPPMMPNTMPRTAMRSEDHIAAVSAAVA
jgi:S1-C subfamily serine protease